MNQFGMVNFFTFFKHTQPWMAAISTVEYGDPLTQKDLLEKLSPLGRLDRIRAATMVQHGANDTNVPVIEAEQIVAHLKSRNLGRVNPLSGRGPRLAEDGEPNQVDGGNGAVLRPAPQTAVANRPAGSRASWPRDGAETATPSPGRVCSSRTMRRRSAKNPADFAPVGSAVFVQTCLA